MIEPRYELMIRDVIAETMDHFMDTVSRCVLNSVPVPDVVLEEKFCQNMMECVADILKAELKARASTPHKFADGTEVVFTNVTAPKVLSPRGFKVFQYLNNALEEILHGRKD